MTLSYVSAGAYLSSITNSHGTIPFAAQDLATVETINVATGAIGVEASSGMALLGAVVDGDGSFHYTLQSAGGAGYFQILLEGIVDNSAGVESIRFQATLTMGATLRATHAFHNVDISLRLPVIGASSATGRVMIPGVQPEVFGWDQMPTSESTWSHPGLQDRGGEHPLNASGDSGTNESDEPSGNLRSGSASFVQLAAAWDETTGLGCIFRTTDKRGRGKVWSITRDSGTNDMVVTVRMAPRDNRTGLGGTSDEAFAYGLEVRPFLSPQGVTAFDDVVFYYLARAEAEAHPFTEKGRLLDRNDYPAAINTAPAFAAMTTSDGFDWSLWTENASRILARTGPGTLFQLYGFWEGPIGRDFPTMTWASGASEAVAALVALGVEPVLYCIAIHLGVWDGSAGLPPGQAINGFLALDRAGDPIIGETPVVGGDSGGLVYIAPSWRDASATSAILDYIIAQVTAGSGAEIHLYLDAHNAFSPGQNEDPAAPASERGFGSNDWSLDNRAVIDTTRARLVAAGATDPVIVSEHPNEVYVGAADLFFDDALGPAVPNLITSKVMACTKLFGRYSRIASFAGFGDGPDPDDYAGYAVTGYFTVGEVLASLWAYGLHAGQMASFLRFFSLNSNVYFPDGAGTDYTEWEDFICRLYFEEAAAIRHYQRCRRLREIDGYSFVTRMVSAVVNEDPTEMLAFAGRLNASAWYDDDNDVVALFVTNHSLPSGNPTTRTFAPTLTTSLFPALGASPREVRVKVVGGGVSEAQAYDGGGSYTFAQGTSAGRVILIEMTPVGSTAGFIGPVTPDLVDFDGEMAGMVSYTAEIGGVTIQRQTGNMAQGTNKTLRLTIPIGSSGYDHTDVSASILSISKGGTAALTKTLAAGDITATSDATNIYLSCPLVPADTSSLAGVYDVEWVATIDGSLDQMASGVLNIRAAVAS